MVYENPPLAELIVDFRWVPMSLTGTVVHFPIISAGPEIEKLYSAFGEKVAEMGFLRSERLAPQGMPVPTGAPLYRYFGNDSNPMIIQTGPGVLSVHAIPPYRSWDAVRPVVAQALHNLVITRPATAESHVFNRIVLRYINVFTPYYMSGRTSSAFMSEVLGLKLTLPVALQKETDVSEPGQAQVALLGKTAAGQDYSINCGQKLDASEEVLLDIGIGENGEFPWQSDTAMAVLETAHTSIRNVFTGMTASISDLMKPVSV